MFSIKCDFISLLNGSGGGDEVRGKAKGNINNTPIELGQFSILIFVERCSPACLPVRQEHKYFIRMNPNILSKCMNLMRVAMDSVGLKLMENFHGASYNSYTYTHTKEIPSLK